MLVLRRINPRSWPTYRSLSTVEAGTIYEKLVVSIFNRLGASVDRTGGASDNGVDFYGDWQLPNHCKFQIAGQCKHYEHKRIGPAIIREWEGVMSRQDNCLGMVVTTSGFTPSGTAAALSSAYPIALVTIDSPLKANVDSTDWDKVRGFIWNRAAQPFIGRLMVAKKHFDIQKVDLGDPARFTIQLFWDGKPLDMNTNR
ncbi:hypothetical protein IWW36_000902 [Coemansia brasiliensis]|uniref:Restriction endonuclease type IV Mrr domain-containing protein n=1 Tax=Coemansia brasiliensis TaxID=2650707 RepID=A0A9W8IGL3_9FUNG|nr:hypothetical protein IWW36_000902 [Coemansia brasiliensis]